MKEKRFKPIYAKELIRVAKSDLDTAKVLLDGGAKRKENILFHIQQAVEKSLKALLCGMGQPIPLTHDLGILLDRVEHQTTSPFEDEFLDLTPFATIRRYEEGFEEFQDEELVEAMNIANKAQKWCEQEINKIV